MRGGAYIRRALWWRQGLPYALMRDLVIRLPREDDTPSMPSPITLFSGRAALLFRPCVPPSVSHALSELELGIAFLRVEVASPDQLTLRQWRRGCLTRTYLYTFWERTRYVLQA